MAFSLTSVHFGIEPFGLLHAPSPRSRLPHLPVLHVLSNDAGFRERLLSPLDGAPSDHALSSVSGVLVSAKLFRGFLVISLLYGLTIICGWGLVDDLSHVRAVDGCGRNLSLRRFKGDFLGVTFVIYVRAYNDFIRGSSEHIFRSATYGQGALLFTPERYHATFTGRHFRPLERDRGRVVTTNFSNDLVGFFFHDVQFSRASVIMGNILGRVRALRCRTSLVRRFQRECVTGVRTPCHRVTEFCVPGSHRRIYGNKLAAAK